jgi:hypothetical protein
MLTLGEMFRIIAGNCPCMCLLYPGIFDTLSTKDMFFYILEWLVNKIHLQQVILDSGFMWSVLSNNKSIIFQFLATLFTLRFTDN